MKALEFLKQERAHHLAVHNDKSIMNQYDESIKELEELKKEKDLLEKYVQFARLHIETYRCNCGALGRVGYLCSNKECTEQ